MKRLFCSISVLCWFAHQLLMAQMCYNPTSNSLIPESGAYATNISVMQDSSGVNVSYVLGTIALNQDDLFPAATRLDMDGFGQSFTPGSPWLPLRSDVHYLDAGCENFRLEILSANSVEYPMEIAPARMMLFEQEESASSIDEVLPVTGCRFSSQDSIAKIIRIGGRGGMAVVSVLVRPVQYDSENKKIRVYNEFEYRLSYDKSEEDIDASISYPRPSPYHAWIGNRINLSYLVIGPVEYQSAATKFMEWKEQMGFKVIGKFADNLTPSQIKETIDSVYQKNRTLDYVLLLGDNKAIPGMAYCDYFSGTGSISYMSDFDYSCVDADDVPDLHIGRIPGKSLADISASLDKIVSYEKNPPTSGSYYNTCLLNAYFQTEYGNSVKTSRRFVETCEEIKDYLTQFGVTGVRNYYAAANVNPKYWSSGLEIPQDLQRPSYAWSGNADAINAAIKSGCNLVITRTHGAVNRWATPDYGVSDVSKLANLSSSNFPIVYSLSCNTGNFESHTTGLCQALISKRGSGCVGAVGATNVSFTKLNDFYAHGIVSHLWPEPGLFRPMYDSSIPVLGLETKYGPTLGETLESANLRMDELAPLSMSYLKYQKRLYHIFGDPSMWIHTERPTAVSLRADMVMESPTDMPVLKVSIGDVKGLISIKDAEGHNLLFYDSDVTMKSLCLPATITVSGHNLIPVTRTYQAPSISSPLPEGKAYQISKVVVDRGTAIYVHTSLIPLQNLMPGNYGLIVFSANGMPVYAGGIDIDENVHQINVSKWKIPDVSMPTYYVVALTFNGEIIDTKTFVMNR